MVNEPMTLNKPSGEGKKDETWYQAKSNAISMVGELAKILC